MQQEDEGHELSQTVEQVPGQTSLEDQIATVTAADIDAHLAQSLADAQNIGTGSVGSLIDAAGALESTDRLAMITRPEGRVIIEPEPLSHKAIYASVNKQSQDGNMVALVNRLSGFVDMEPSLPVGQQYYPRKAIAAFQQEAGLKADGRYTPQTHDALWASED